MAYGIVHHFPGGTKEQSDAVLAAVHVTKDRSCGASLSMPALRACSRTKCHTAFSVSPSPQPFPLLFTLRNSLPALM